MKSSTAVVLVVAVIIVAGAAWWMFGQGGTTNNQANITTNVPAEQPVDTTPPATGTTTTTLPTATTVHLTASGFSPASVTIAKGGTVTFVNDTQGPMWVASAPHPTHTGYDGTSRTVHCAAGYTGPAPFDQCAAGSSFSFTFTKTGSWLYHDHLNTGASGTVVVQ